jgi:Tfp pilus assembly protein PilX
VKRFLVNPENDRIQRGAVLPLAMLILLVLSAVLLGLASLTGQEPLAARNHTLIAQAQGVAEAGLDRALWALSTPGTAGSVPWTEPAPEPYDGSRLIDVAIEGLPLGAFRLTISGTGDRQRQIVVSGFAPAVSGQLGQARQDVSATAIRLRFPSLPAGLTVRGDLQVGPGVTIDATEDASCGNATGTWSTGATTVGAGSQVRGRMGDLMAPNGPADVTQMQSPDLFDGLTFEAAEMSAFKALARARGTYHRGPVTFDAARRIPDGLTFVDTVSGQPISPATPAADLAAVSVRDGASTDPNGLIRGWIVVNGSLSLDGDVTLEGLAFAADRFSQSGSARVRGAAIAGHVRSTAPSLIDARPGSGPALTWSCQAGKTGGGSIPQRWMVKPGSYREAAI